MEAFIVFALGAAIGIAAGSAATTVVIAWRLRSTRRLSRSDVEVVREALTMFAPKTERAAQLGAMWSQLEAQKGNELGGRAGQVLAQQAARARDLLARLS